MMSFDGGAIKKALEVLKETGGYFVFRDEGGEEFFLSRMSDFDHQKVATQDISDETHLDKDQGKLSLPTTESLARDVEEVAHELDTTPDFILRGINQEIATVREESLEQEVDDLSLEAAKTEPGKKVRFEAITGDLAPELQE